MAKFAVLHDLSEETSVPVGLALETENYVLVHLPREYGVPERHSGEYRVLDPDLQGVVYRPGDAGYYDQVLIGLSRMFGIGEQGNVAVIDDNTLLRLYVSKVDRPRERKMRGLYDVHLTFARDVAPSTIRVAYGTQPLYRAQPDELAIAARSRGVAA